MKFLKKLLKYTLVLIGLLVVLLYIFDYDYLLKAVRTIYLSGHTTAYLEDYKKFDNRTIEADIPQPWPNHKNYNSVNETEVLNTTNETYGTVAFVIIKNDSIWFENYYDGYDDTTKSNSFSMAKSMVTSMLGKAIMEGKIESLDQPVGDYFQEFSEGKAARLTVGDLASMASGLNWDESYYSPFSITTRAYFYDDLERMMLGVKVVEEPGQSYKYLSGNTQLLGMVIEKATGQTLSNYLSSKFWKPLGAEHDALWQIDKEENGLEKAYCCVASNARDFARFGKLYKDYGRWNGEQLLDSAFVQKSATPRFAESPEYGYGWWLHKKDDKSLFLMRGHLGQMVIVDRTNNVIIVRLGHKRKPQKHLGEFAEDVDVYIEETYKMLNSSN